MLKWFMSTLTDQNWIELNLLTRNYLWNRLLLYYEGFRCGIKSKVIKRVSLTREVGGDIIIHIHWLYQNQFLVSKILSRHVTNFITPTLSSFIRGHCWCKFQLHTMSRSWDLGGRGTGEFGVHPQTAWGVLRAKLRKGLEVLLSSKELENSN